MEIEGRLIQKLGIQSGKSARGDWAKQEFVIEFQEGNFPSKACFSVWGADKVKDLEKYQPGDQIKVAFNVSSREFNGKWYTDLRAWRISPAGAQAPDTERRLTARIRQEPLQPPDIRMFRPDLLLHTGPDPSRFRLIR